MPVIQQNITSNRSRAYLAQQINAMTPMELLIKLYDAAIASCAQKDSRRLSQALVELIATLNFEYREIAVGLFRLYNYCLRNGKRGRFELVEPILTELRDTWKQAMERDQQPAQHNEQAQEVSVEIAQTA